MKDKQAFIEALDLQKDRDGHWHVNGTVWGDVACIYGDVGTVNGCVHAVNGDVDTVRGNVKGDVGNVLGTVLYSVGGTIDGRKWKFVEENNDE